MYFWILNFACYIFLFFGRIFDFCPLFKVFIYYWSSSCLKKSDFVKRIMALYVKYKPLFLVQGTILSPQYQSSETKVIFPLVI